MVHALNTDVFVILLSNFHYIYALNTAAEIWISFKAGKQVPWSPWTILTPALERQNFSFKFKGKWYCCKLIHEVPSLTEEFETVVNTLFQTLLRLKRVAAQFVCRLYCYDSNGDNVIDLIIMTKGVLSEDLRCEEISQKSDAYRIHIRKGVYSKRAYGQSSYVYDAFEKPVDHGWKKRCY